MAGPLPLILAGGAALALLGGKKKRRRRVSRAGESCVADVPVPTGYVCEDGVLQMMVVDEEDLEREEEISEEDAGEFKTEEEDVSPEEGEEEADSASLVAEESPKSPEEMCDEFLQAVHVVPTETGELPVNKIAVEQTVIPSMSNVMEGIAKNIGTPLDPESVGPVMVLQALKDLVPVCDWKYDDANDEFVYDDGRTIESNTGKEVLYGLMQLSVQLLDEFNKPKDESENGPVLAQFKQG